MNELDPQSTSTSTSTVRPVSEMVDTQSVDKGKGKQSNSNSNSNNISSSTRSQNNYSGPNEVRFPSPTAVFFSELHWWTSDEDIVTILNTLNLSKVYFDTEITFSEHKVNGKSKGLAFLECATEIDARIIKSHFQTHDFQTKKIQVVVEEPNLAGNPNPYRTLPKEANAPNYDSQGNRKYGQSQSSIYKPSSMYNKIPRSNQPQPGSYPNYAVGSGPGTTYYNYQVQQQQAVMEMMFGDESSRKRTRNQ